MTPNLLNNVEYLSDFAIITPLPLELEALLTNLGKGIQVEQFAIDQNTYHLLEFPTADNNRYQIVVMLLPSMGNLSAAVATQHLVSTWRPRNLVVCGIAAGTRPAEQRFGDVIVADSILYYELGKIRAKAVEVRPRMLSVDPLLFDRALNFATASRKDRPSQQVFFGPVASGEKVYSSRAAVERLLQLQPKLMGIEMESAGVASVALGAVEKIGFLSVRGISDFADAAKDDSAQARAANAAAKWLTRFLLTCPLAARQKAARRPTPFIVLEAPADQTRLSLFNEIRKRLDNEEFKTFCFVLGVDIDDLPGDRKSARVRELILRFERLGALDKLAAMWSEFPEHYLS